MGTASTNSWTPSGWRNPWSVSTYGSCAALAWSGPAAADVRSCTNSRMSMWRTSCGTQSRTRRSARTPRADSGLPKGSTPLKRDRLHATTHAARESGVRARSLFAQRDRDGHEKNWRKSRAIRSASSTHADRIRSHSFTHGVCPELHVRSCNVTGVTLPHFQPGTRLACSIHLCISGPCASSRVFSLT